MFFWADFEASRRRSAELIREADHYRLLSAAKRIRTHRGKSLASQAIKWLAGQLIRWGSLLQERYGDSAPRPA